MTGISDISRKRLESPTENKFVEPVFKKPRSCSPEKAEKKKEKYEQPSDIALNFESFFNACLSFHMDSYSAKKASDQLMQLDQLPIYIDTFRSHSFKDIQNAFSVFLNHPEKDPFYSSFHQEKLYSHKVLENIYLWYLLQGPYKQMLKDLSEELDALKKFLKSDLKRFFSRTERKISLRTSKLESLLNSKDELEKINNWIKSFSSLKDTRCLLDLANNFKDFNGAKRYPKVASEFQEISRELREFNEEHGETLNHLRSNLTQKIISFQNKRTIPPSSSVKPSIPQTRETNTFIHKYGSAFYFGLQKYIKEMLDESTSRKVKKAIKTHSLDSSENIQNVLSALYEDFDFDDLVNILAQHLDLNDLEQKLNEASDNELRMIICYECIKDFCNTQECDKLQIFFTWYNKERSDYEMP